MIDVLFEFYNDFGFWVVFCLTTLIRNATIPLLDTIYGVIYEEVPVYGANPQFIFETIAFISKCFVLCLLMVNANILGSGVLPFCNSLKYLINSM